MVRLSDRDREHHERNEPARSRRCQGSGGNALTFKLRDLAATELQSQAWQTIADEIAHAFLVGDEYALKGATIVPGGFGSLQDRSNLQYALEVLKADGITADVAKIKWNWHRIAAASLITGAMYPLGGENYEVPVAPKSGFRLSPRSRCRSSCGSAPA